jgi:hypothetical protein
MSSWECRRLLAPMRFVSPERKNIYNYYAHSTWRPSTVGMPVKQDAFLVRKLREAGAISMPCPPSFLCVFSPALTSSLPVIGKANLTELASYKSLKAQDGWSAVGGQTINVYNPKASPGNSSAGNGVSVAAGLCPASIATETGWYYSHLFTSSFPSMLTYYD